MCGLAGMIDARVPPEPAELRRMAAALAHRGPDGERVWRSGSTGFAFRRLAILDLTDSAMQPMTSGGNALVFNGEIYNYRELRDQLRALGASFLSTGDSEVVLRALEHWGVDALPRFNGMFALAWRDGADGSVLLARDRYGCKPLYWRKDGERFLFASEIKAVLAVDSRGPRMDAAGLFEYMNFQNFFGERTLFEGISMLPAGTWMRIDADGLMRSRRYWDFNFTPDLELGEVQALDQLEAVFAQAVQRQLVADVPVGAYLSGGIDTGMITATAARDLSDMRSFTIGFDMHSASGLELACDERPAAELMSYLCGTEHYEMVLKAGDMAKSLPAVVRALEEPRAGQSYPNFYAAKLAGSFGKVVLSGTGGDELFGGYPWRYRDAVFGRGMDAFIDSGFRRWQRLAPEKAFDTLFAPIAADVRGLSARDLYAQVFPRDAPPPRDVSDAVNLCLYFEAKTFLHGLLIVEDKLGMAHGLESRFPFLDNDLVDFACRVPVALKLRGHENPAALNENEPGVKKHAYFQRTNNGKLLVRRLAAKYMPKAVAEAEKQGFSAPDAGWFRGESMDFVRDALYAPNARLYQVLDRRTVTDLVDDHLAGRENRRLLIWSLLCLEQWMREWG